jgi:hypothetical protein
MRRLIGRIFRQGLVVVVLLAACANGTLAQPDAKADPFRAVPGKSVIFLVRSDPDAYQRKAEMHLDDGKPVAMYPGTYIRWVVLPGAHQIQGAAPDTALMKLRTEAGKVYYIQQDVGGITAPMSTLQRMSERDGRAAVRRSTRANNR